jgi:DNA-binding NarL/FixJ family response regulator
LPNPPGQSAPSFFSAEPIKHRPVAQRRAEVVTLLGEGLSDREIARRAKVSPSTVATVRREHAEANVEDGRL